MEQWNGEDCYSCYVVSILTPQSHSGRNKVDLALPDNVEIPYKWMTMRRSALQPSLALDHKRRWRRALHHAAKHFKGKLHVGHPLWFWRRGANEGDFSYEDITGQDEPPVDSPPAPEENTATSKT